MKPHYYCFHRRGVAACFCLIVLAALLIPMLGSAATITVTTGTVDNRLTDGRCTLREAIVNANKNAKTSPDCAAGSGSDTIVFSGVTTVNLFATAALPTITDGLVIDGGAGVTMTRTGATAYRIFSFNTTQAVELRALTINKGKVSGGATGAGINKVNSGTLTLTNVTVSNNINSGGNGGGLFNNGTGTVTIRQSAFTGNRANNGGAISNGASSRSIALENVTISGNAAAVHGGGVFANSSAVVINMDSVTIASNTSDNDANGTGNGGGIFRKAGVVNIKNTLIGNNVDKGKQAPDCGGVITSQDYNLIENPAGCTITGAIAHNKIGDPALGGLANNGGATMTHALTCGSPAINAGNTALTTDQRAIARSLGIISDIGAFELPVGTVAFTASTDSAAEGNSGAVSKVVATVSRTGDVSQAISVQVALNASPGTALNPADYTGILPKTVNFAAGDGANKTVSLTIVGETLSEGDETINLVLQNPSCGTVLGAQQTATYTIINDDKPSVKINQAAAQADPTKNSPINFTVEFSVPVSDFAAGDVTLSGTAGGTKTVNVTGIGATYNVAVSGMTDGTVIATIPANVASSNSASTSTDNTVTYDTTPPTVTITPGTNPTNASPTFTVTFSEDVTGFAASDVTLGGTAGGTKTASVSGSGASYIVTVSGMTDGTVTAAIAAGVATDSVGNANEASPSAVSVTYDTTPPNAPNVCVSPTCATPTNDPTPTWSWTSGGGGGNGTYRYKLDNADLTSGATETTSLSYTPTTALGDGTYTLYAQERDAAGNWSSSGSFAITVNAPPVVQNVNSSDGAFNAGDEITLTILFNQMLDVTGTPMLELNVGAAVSVPCVENGYTLKCTYIVAAGHNSSDLDYTATTSLSLNGGTIKDLSGVNADLTLPAPGAQNSLGYNRNIVIDTTAPTVTIEQAGTDPTNVNPTFTVTFSEAVTGFTAAGVTLGGTAGATTATVNGSGAIYTVTVSGMTSDGTVTATIPAGAAIDVADNLSVDSASTDNSVTYDATPPNAPSVCVSPTCATPTTDTTPTWTWTSGGGGNGTYRYQLDDEDLSSLTGDTSTSFTPASALSEGAHTLYAQERDDAGNWSSSGLFSITVNAPPTVTIEQTSGQADPTKNSSITFTVVFSEAVTGFGDVAADVTLGGTANATTATVSGSGATYTVTVSGMTSDGTVTASIPANAATDGSNGNAASTSADNQVTYDATAPTLTVPAPSPVEATSASGAVVTFTATATDAIDTTPTVTCSPASGSAFQLGNTTVTCTATDDAGNISAQGTFTVTVQDTTPPTVTVNPLATADTTPPLSGTITDNTATATATISVTVNGQTYAATNTNGAWTLADNAIAPALAVGVYDVQATANDGRGNTGSDATTNELSIRGAVMLSGQWQDANKTRDGDDDEFCWAAAAANLLAWGNWGTTTYNTAQTIFANFKAHWTDAMGQMNYGWQWWLNGLQPPARGYTGSTVNAAGGGNYWSSMLAADYFYLNGTTSVLLDTIKQAFAAGYGVTGGIINSSTLKQHAITIWGYEYDATNAYTGMYLTDADDGITGLRYVPLIKIGDYWTLSGDYAGWQLREIQAFGQRGGQLNTAVFGGMGMGTGLLYGNSEDTTTAAVPEPATIGLFGLGLLGLGWLCHRRKHS